jgi:hypothetical protein
LKNNPQLKKNQSIIIIVAKSIKGSKKLLEMTIIVRMRKRASAEGAARKTDNKVLKKCRLKTNPTIMFSYPRPGQKECGFKPLAWRVSAKEKHC